MLKGMITAIEYQKLPYEEQKNKRMIIGYIDDDDDDYDYDSEEDSDYVDENNYSVTCGRGHRIEIKELCEQCIDELEFLIEGYCYDDSLVYEIN